MIYQETFQSGENPSEINVSSCIYINGVRQQQTHGNDKNFEYPIHCHSFFEIQYIVKGRGETQLNGRQIDTPDNSLLLVPPLSVHGSYGSDKRIINLVMQFSYDFLWRNAGSFRKNSMLVPTGELLENGVIKVEKESLLEYYLLEISGISPSFITPVVLERADIEYSMEYEWKLNGLTLMLIDQLLETGNLTIENNTGSVSDVVQIQSVLNRLITRPEEKLGMEEAARMACMSYSNFSRTFAKIIGRSFVDFCNDSKVHRAEELLKSTNTTITEISQKLGFGSVSYFNRIFKAYNGTTPLQYRDKFRAKK